MAFISLKCVSTVSTLMGSHAPQPTQPLTCHVNDVLGYGTFRPGSVLARKNMEVSAKSMDVSANKI